MVLAPDTTDPKPGDDVLVGKVLDRYRVLEKIGEGGMGSVYRVEHIMLQKHMAMKLLRFELSQNQDLVTRFQNEAIAAGRIGQENIVAVTDFGRTPDGLVYFVMEELHGQSLAVAICNSPCFPVARTINIAAQCCRALHAAHAVGIVHRDLKPENVVLTEREGVADFVKILDFGISKIIEMTPNPEGQKLTRAGMIVGTPEYMSPEQAGGRAVDARSDIYSLGIVIFEMIAGRLPFSAENALQMLMMHQTGEVPTFAKAQPGLKVPGRLEKVVRRALSKKPEDRQQSMAELLNELQACAENLDLTQPGLKQLRPSRISIPQGRVAPTRPSAGLEQDDLVVAGLARKPGRLRMPVALAVAAVALLVAVAGLTSKHKKLAPAAVDAPAAGAQPTPAPTPVVAPTPAEAAVAPVQAPAAAPPPEPPEPAPARAEQAPSHSARIHPSAPSPPRAHKPKAVHANAASKAEPSPYQKVDELKAPYQQ